MNVHTYPDQTFQPSQLLAQQKYTNLLIIAFISLLIHELIPVRMGWVHVTLNWWKAILSRRLGCMMWLPSRWSRGWHWHMINHWSTRNPRVRWRAWESRWRHGEMRWITIYNVLRKVNTIVSRSPTYRIQKQCNVYIYALHEAKLSSNLKKHGEFWC